MLGRKENILVVKTDSLAGFVAAEPAFEAIREAHRSARISLLTTNALQRIGRAAPYFDQVAAMPDLRDVEARKAFFKQVRDSRFARVYDLSGDETARRLQAGLGPFGPKWIAAAPPAPKARKGEAAPPPEGPSLSFAAPDRLPDFAWALAARKDSANMQPSWFGVSGHFGLLLPGPDAARRWPAERYGEFARLMARNGVMPVLIGAKELHEFADEVAHAAPEIVDLTGKTDHLQLVALAREAAFFVTDSGEEAHLALATGCGGVVIRKASEAHLAPRHPHAITLTTKTDMGEAAGDFVWRSLRNMGLIPQDAALAKAAAR